jgi:uncharacterized cupredoxin-like copper-binding protein
VRRANTTSVYLEACKEVTVQRIIVLILADVALVALGCSDTTVKNDPTGTAAPAATATKAAGTATAGAATTTVTTQLKEFTLAAAPQSAPSGTVKFQAQNSGTTQHELLVVRSEAAPGDLPMQSDGTKVDESKVDVRLAIHSIDPGKTGSEDVKLAPGKYVLICNIPAHYKAGMSAPFTVNP